MQSHGAHPTAFEADFTTNISDEQITRAMRRAHRIRARCVARLARGVRARLRSLIAGGWAPPGGRPGGRPGAALASLRSSAETLRDDPEIDAARRGRRLEAILKKETRLERLVRRMGDRPDRRASRPT